MIREEVDLIEWAESRPEVTGPVFMSDAAPSLLVPLPYQEEALVEYRLWRHSSEREAAILLTVGMGKTITAIMCLREDLQVDPKSRILWLTHRMDLVSQSSEEIARFSGFRPGIEQADRRAGTYERVVVASVDTLRGRRLEKFAKNFRPTLIICDEAHHALARTWLLIKQAFAQAKILNLTATPYRRDVQARLLLGKVLIERNTSDGIKIGRLVPPKPVGRLEVDLGKVKKQLGDYATGSLASLLSQEDVIKASAELLAQHLPGRKGIIFGADVAHTRLLSAAVREKGFRVGEIYAATPRMEREELQRQLLAGELDALANNLILCEGFNLPAIDLVAIFRPTKNAALYLQMLGRGLRSCPERGKKDCLVIDVLDLPKTKGADASLPLPEAHDVFAFQAMSGRPASPALVFLNWFTLTVAAQEAAKAQGSKLHVPRFPTGHDFLSVLRNELPNKWPKSLVKAATELEEVFAGVVTEPSESWGRLWRAVGVQQPEALVRALHSRGWGYFPRDAFTAPKLPPAPAQEGGKEEKKAVNFSLKTLLSDDATLRNFCLDLLGEPELDKQAEACYELHPVGQRPVVWNRALFNQGFPCTFMQSEDGVLWLRAGTNRIRAYVKSPQGWTPDPKKVLRYGTIPWSSRSTSWAKEVMTDKQAVHVARIMKLSEEQMKARQISRLAASAIMSAFWKKNDLETIRASWKAQPK